MSASQGKSSFIAALKSRYLGKKPRRKYSVAVKEPAISKLAKQILSKNS